MRRSWTGSQQFKVLESEDCSNENHSFLTEEILKKESRCFDLDIIFTFRYTGKGLRKMGGMASLENLTSLDLSSNEIERMEGLESLASLENLNLGRNRIRRIENIQNLTKLRTLNLEHNRLQEVEDLNLNSLSKLMGLKDLRIRGVESEKPQNPVCSHSRLSDLVFAALPELKCFDGERRHSLRLSSIDQDISELKTNPPKKMADAISWPNPEPFFSTSTLAAPPHESHLSDPTITKQIKECKENIRGLRELDAVLCKKIGEGCNGGQ
ncbi:hypothetical protein BSKO_13007 [Bryopsis sp. KO-2023]|nr:hypothetical protein BSKO_13007 [Bryopsis sp. KO-2023]